MLLDGGTPGTGGEGRLGGGEERGRQGGWGGRIGVWALGEFGDICSTCIFHKVGGGGAASATHRLCAKGGSFRLI